MALAVIVSDDGRRTAKVFLGKQTASDVFVTALLANGIAFLVVIGHARLALAVVVPKGSAALLFME